MYYKYIRYYFKDRYICDCHENEISEVIFILKLIKIKCNLYLFVAYNIIY